MASVLSKVILVGATGTVGGPILDVLLEDPSDNFEITILTRSDSSATFTHLPDKIHLKQTDYSDLTALTSIFQGKDAIVHASAIPGLVTQKLMIEAAVAAGVQRFILNEYANSYDNQPGLLQELERFRDVKRDVLELAKQKAEGSGGRFSWSALATGNMLDLSLKRYGPVIGIDVRNRKARLVDGGVERFTAVVMRDIGIAVRGMLRNPEATRNRFCHVRSVETSQGELLDVCRGLVDGQWEVQDESGEEMYRRGSEAFAKGERSGMLDLLVCQLFQKGKGRSIVVSRDASDNELLGVREKDAKEVVKDALPYFPLA